MITHVAILCNVMIYHSSQWTKRYNIIFNRNPPQIKHFSCYGAVRTHRVEDHKESRNLCHKAVVSERITVIGIWSTGNWGSFDEKIKLPWN